MNYYREYSQPNKPVITDGTNRIKKSMYYESLLSVSLYVYAIQECISINKTVSTLKQITF